jgi:hypothetical protein
VTDAMQVACAMMIYDKSQEQVEAAFSRVK